MARATLALLLTAALYLGFTLLSSTDENLLLNAQVAVVPQIGFGMALEKSYIFGPPIFLYLHVQGLFLLSVLYRKIQRFETTLDQKLPGILDSHPAKQEYWSLLSAFTFVQLFRRNGHFPHVSILLAWISIEAIPLALLFVVDLSFVRYQSCWITNSHHIIVLLALISVVWFNWRVFERRFRLRWALIRFVLPGSLVLLLFFQAQPPSFDLKSVEDDAQNKATQENGNTREIFDKMMEEQRNRIWRADSKKSWHTMWEDIQEKGNVFDAVCEQWARVCRYLNVRDLWLVSTWSADAVVHKIDESGDTDFDSIRWSNLNKLSLAGRNLHFADFRFSQLPGVSLEGARLQGANLANVNLQGANLAGAIMHGVFLHGAELQDANFFKAQLHSANLSWAKLQNARMHKAQLWNSDISEAELQRAKLVEAELQGADMKFAKMDGTRLRGAKLVGTNLKGARLRGASLSKAELLGTNLQDAQLQGADLREAKLKGTDLEGTQFQGVDLHSAEIQYSFGDPKSWKLAWMRNASFNSSDKNPVEFFNILSEKPKFESNRLWWIKGTKSLKDYIQKIANQNRPWLSEYDLREEKWVIFGKKRSDCMDATTSEYWEAWTDWTADFACRNEYTGYVSVRRWGSKNPLFGIEECVGPKNLYREKRNILDKLKLKGSIKDSDCPGLRTIPDGGWKISDSDWGKEWKDAWSDDDD